ncbi:MAG TPA: hypothetical protein VLG44_00410 [Chlamydiales bacterium]|nr:hypothetical protein [Chlamydiales bacterium]
MKRTSFLLVGTFLLAWATFHFDSLMAKPASPGINFDAMTKEEEFKTGLHKLSTAEKLALQEWVAQSYSAKPKAARPPQISEVLANGQYVQLTDGSLWKIHPNDTPITQGWITPVEIIVQQNGTPPYNYTLTNSLTGSIVRAQAASSLPPEVQKNPNPPPPPPENKKKPPK